MFRSTIIALSLVTLMATAAVASRTSGLQKGAMEVLGQSYVESIDVLFDVGAGGRLSLGTTMGSIRVQTWSRDQIRLVVTKSTRAADVDAARRMLAMFSVRARHGGRDLALKARARSKECAKAVGVEFTIWVPKSYNLNIKTKNGSIELPEVDGTFSAHTDDGTITLDCDTETLDIEVEDKSEATSADEPDPTRGDDSGSDDVEQVEEI
jgi:hypothetical protein